MWASSFRRDPHTGQSTIKAVSELPHHAFRPCCAKAEDLEIVAEHLGHAKCCCDPECPTSGATRKSECTRPPELSRVVIGWDRIHAVGSTQDSQCSWSRCDQTVVSIFMSRVRHCVECPKCRTRYLPSFSQWGSTDLKPYEICGQAYRRGYGSPDEVWDVTRDSRVDSNWRDVDGRQ
jgi:hypothetical protein